MLTVIMESLFLYKLNRILHRIFWKISTNNEQRYLAIVQDKIAKSLYPEIASIDETIDKLLNGKYSIARYGDGEFTLCFYRPIGFQKADRELRKRLREILKSKTENCLIALPECKLENISPFWIHYWYDNLDDILKLFRKDVRYYNQSISREFSIEQITRLKKLWTNRYVVFVFGKGSRFDCTHEIFSEIKGHSIVYGLPQNAWEEYSKLLNDVKVEITKHENPLILISLGPTATVLAYDLSQKGNQAIDIGHITNMYDKLVYGKAKPEELPFSK